MSLSDIVDFLSNYPLKETPYPKGYPEDLKFDLYPGQDFVIGFCDEAIEAFTRSYAETKNKDARELCANFAQLFEQIKDKRQKKLDSRNARKPEQKQEVDFEKVLRDALF